MFRRFFQGTSVGSCGLFGEKFSKKCFASMRNAAEKRSRERVAAENALPSARLGRFVDRSGLRIWLNSSNTYRFWRVGGRPLVIILR